MHFSLEVSWEMTLELHSLTYTGHRKQSAGNNNELSSVDELKIATPASEKKCAKSKHHSSIFAFESEENFQMSRN